MTTNYDHIAQEYKRSKQVPWRLHIEHFTFFELLGDLSGRSVLDLACGEGYYTRKIRERGAKRVLGVDVSNQMIQLARTEEAQNPLGIEYLVHDVRSLELEETFDLVVAAYLFNYARDREELLAMCQAVARSMKPGCRFITVNSNPDHPPENFSATRKYGFIKTASKTIQEGTPVIWTFVLEDRTFAIENYHLSISTHEWVLRAAGLRQICWYPPRLSPLGEKESGTEFWSEFLEHPPIIFLECIKEIQRLS
jgi:ubiquinone/menaquinone biosynthesis C-methylase UbiE